MHHTPRTVKRPLKIALRLEALFTTEQFTFGHLWKMFVPLVYTPGHAQADFGEALAVIGGVEQKIHYFAFDLAHSDASFVVAYPAEPTEAFCAGHVQAFAFFGARAETGLAETGKAGVPQ